MIRLTHTCGHEQDHDPGYAAGEEDWYASQPCGACNKAQSPQRPGWSNAAKARAAQRGGTHPLGRAVEDGDGYTVYEDEAFGGGRVQIWDKS